MKPKNTGGDGLSLLQQIFLTQESNWSLLHCRWILYHLSHRGSPRILEWVAYPFSRGSSWPRNQTGVSGIAGRFFTNWATWETPHDSKIMLKNLQATLQQYVNKELPDVPAGFRKGRGTRDQIANIRRIIEKAREFFLKIYFCFTDYTKSLWLYGWQQTVENSERDGNPRPLYLPSEKPVCRSKNNI